MRRPSAKEKPVENSGLGNQAGGTVARLDLAALRNFGGDSEISEADGRSWQEAAAFEISTWLICRAFLSERTLCRSLARFLR